MQGLSGLTRFAGERGKEPVRFGSNYAGVTASMYAVQAILAALYWRRQSGEGQYVETSYLRAMIATQQNYLTSFSDPDEISGNFYGAHLQPSGARLPDEGPPDRVHPRLRPQPGCAPAAPGAHGRPRGGARRLAVRDRRIDAEDLAAVTPYIEQAFLNHGSEELLRILDELGVMCAPVHDYDSMFHDEGILEQDALLTVEHPTRGDVRMGGLAWKLSDTPGAVRLAPPTLGEHTDAVLAEIGYDEQRIAALRAGGVVR